MEILTAAQMTAIDRDSNARGVPVRVLMENAGAAVARFCRDHYPGVPVVVLCGKGNNGGDGAVAARLLAETRNPVKLLLLGSIEEAQGDAAAYTNFRDRYRDMARTLGFEGQIAWAEAMP